MLEQISLPVIFLFFLMEERFDLDVEDEDSIFFKPKRRYVYKKLLPCICPGCHKVLENRKLLKQHLIQNKSKASNKIFHFTQLRL